MLKILSRFFDQVTLQIVQILLLLGHIFPLGAKLGCGWRTCKENTGKADAAL